MTKWASVFWAAFGFVFGSAAVAIWVWLALRDPRLPWWAGVRIGFLLASMGLMVGLAVVMRELGRLGSRVGKLEREWNGEPE